MWALAFASPSRRSSLARSCPSINVALRGTCDHEASNSAGNPGAGPGHVPVRCRPGCGRCANCRCACGWQHAAAGDGYLPRRHRHRSLPLAGECQRSGGAELERGAQPAGARLPRCSALSQGDLRSPVPAALGVLAFVLLDRSRRRPPVRTQQPAAEEPAHAGDAGQGRRPDAGTHRRRSEYPECRRHDRHRLVRPLARRQAARGVDVRERQRGRLGACVRCRQRQAGLRSAAARAVPDRRREPRLARRQQGFLVHALSGHGAARGRSSLLHGRVLPRARPGSGGRRLRVRQGAAQDRRDRPRQPAEHPLRARHGAEGRRRRVRALPHRPRQPRHAAHPIRGRGGGGDRRTRRQYLSHLAAAGATRQAARDAGERAGAGARATAAAGIRGRPADPRPADRGHVAGHLPARDAGRPGTRRDPRSRWQAARPAAAAGRGDRGRGRVGGRRHACSTASRPTSGPPITPVTTRPRASRRRPRSPRPAR